MKRNDTKIIRHLIKCPDCHCRPLLEAILKEKAKKGDLSQEAELLLVQLLVKTEFSAWAKKLLKMHIKNVEQNKGLRNYVATLKLAKLLTSEKYRDLALSLYSVNLWNQIWHSLDELISIMEESNKARKMLLYVAKYNITFNEEKILRLFELADNGSKVAAKILDAAKHSYNNFQRLVYEKASKQKIAHERKNR